MSGCFTCGSTSLPCGCCEGMQTLTPAPIFNRPGLPAINYRVGTHAGFLQTMRSRLATVEVEGEGVDRQAGKPFRPLRALATRDSSDFSIALLDGWATVADLLSFYSERIVNEGYLRTATERRSVLELGRLVGYTPRPGVAASVYLAYQLDDNQIDASTIAAGARAQSLPGPGEMPQSFETNEDLLARREWNNLQVRLHRPQNITLSTVLQIERIVVSDTVNGLKAGNPLLFNFSADGRLAAMRSVRAIEGPTANGRWTIHLLPVDPKISKSNPLLVALVAHLLPFVSTADSVTLLVIRAAQDLLSRMLLDHAESPVSWARDIFAAGNERQPSVAVTTLVNQLADDVKIALGNASGTAQGPSSPDTFVTALLKPRVLQAANSLQLKRDLGRAFMRGADTAPQLLLNFAPTLQDSYYTAWASAAVNNTSPVLQGVYALRSNASLFGSNVQRQASTVGGTMPPQSQWPEWTLDRETMSGLFLEQLQPALTAPGFAVVVRMDDDEPGTKVYTITQAATAPRAAYGISGKTTHLQFDREWWQARTPTTSGLPNDMAVLRATLVWAQSEPLTLVEEPISDIVGTQPADARPLSIELGALYKELTSGRWVILAGERADIPGVTGVQAAELMMLSGLVHGYDSTLPGDLTHTTLQLATTSAFRYKRETLVIHGNVVAATHGETRNEVLGSGDATAALQSFTLKQPPLTFTAAPTAAGAQSSLAVYVDELQWHETPSLAWLGPKHRGYITRTDDDQQTSIVFGDGVHGARLTSGVQNVRAVYRTGIGSPGNVRVGQINLLASRPLGVKAVLNPLRASGGAEREDHKLARDNTSLALMALDRLVSVQDYADFTRTFAGIAKAVATHSSDGARELVFLSIAGVDDAPIDKTSDLYRNLLAALRKLGDAELPLRVDLRELRTLVLSANIALLPDYRWEPVAAAVRAQLLATFGFGSRTLGQSVCVAELFAAIQGVRGLAYVDIDAFTSIAEKRTAADGTRQLVTQELISAQVLIALNGDFQQSDLQAPGALRRLKGSLPRDVIAFRGGIDEEGVLRPAELAIFSPAVPDTLILKQVQP
jgi:predicted phage baseplate assembly protein